MQQQVFKCKSKAVSLEAPALQNAAQEFAECPSIRLGPCCDGLFSKAASSAPIMVQDDLSSWLKASAENKITSRNAWQSTLIEHFVDTDKFAARDGINFHRASSTLEGCMKVYSTRVDDVSENTLKLLEIFNKDDDAKRRTGAKKKSNFIEKNLANINLKEKEASDFYDPLFSSILLKTDDYFLMDILEPTASGMVLFSGTARDIVMEDERVDVDAEQLPICDSLRDFEAAVHSISDDQHRAPELGMADFTACERSYGQDFEDSGETENVNNADGVSPADEVKTGVFQESPFGYFKGWAGPAHWKVQLGSRGKEGSEKRPKQRYFLDFAAGIDQSLLENKSDTVLSKQAIVERRKRKNFLPEDYSYEVKDLYRFLKMDGYFSANTSNSVDEDGRDAGSNIGNGVGYGSVKEDAHTDIELDMDGSFADHFEASLVLNDKPAGDTSDKQIQLKYSRVQKRVDIKRLKDSVSALLKQRCNRFSQIVSRIPDSYTSKESRNISPHFCLISLLHLANEMELEIKTVDGDLLISSCMQK